MIYDVDSLNWGFKPIKGYTPPIFFFALLRQKRGRPEKFRPTVFHVLSIETFFPANVPI